MNLMKLLMSKRLLFCLSLTCYAYSFDWFVITNTDTNTVGTLRFAINQAMPGDTIKFALPPSQLTITLTSNLPILQSNVLVDGTTQPGFVQNGPPLVEVTGNLGINGFSTLSNDTIKSLIINKLSSAITFNFDNNIADGCYIGTDRTGTIAQGNSNGIFLIGMNNIVQNSLISGNPGAGVVSANSGNFITNNIIGTNSAGSLALGNSTGVTFSGSSSTVENCVISGNTSIGVLVATGAEQNSIQQNFIGTDSLGRQIGNNFGVAISQTQDISQTSITGNIIAYNSSIGINISSSLNNKILRNRIFNNLIGVIINDVSSNNIVGGTFADANTIFNNTLMGVAIGGTDTDASVGNSVLFNSIADNGLLGIDLGTTGSPKPNVPINPVPGTPNNSQNHPDLSSAGLSCDSIAVSFSLHSVPLTGFTIQFFQNTVDRNPAITEGKTFIGEVLVLTDANGDASGTATFIPVSCVRPGDFISATATNMTTGDTSEFSFNVPVVFVQGADLAITKTTSQCESDKIIFTLSIVNNGPCDATKVIVTDTLPQGVKVDKICAQGWDINLQDGLLAATRATLEAGTTSEIIIKATSKCKDAMIINTASVRSACTPDPDLTNNSAFSVANCKVSVCKERK